MSQFSDAAASATQNNEKLNRTDRRASIREKIRLLVIGGVEQSYALHDSFLKTENTSLSSIEVNREWWMIPDYQELSVIPRDTDFQTAILHETLSLTELDDACRFIRRQWPNVRILVIRGGEGFLDDALYDERLPPASSSEAMIAAIARNVGTQARGKARDERRRLSKHQAAGADSGDLLDTRINVLPGANSDANARVLAFGRRINAAENRESETEGMGINRLSEDQKRKIRQRAYELYEARGKEHGHDLEDWLQAELEMTVGNCL